MANYNILMNRFNGTTHDTLLPKNHLEGTSNPTTSTVGIVGQFYLNTTTKQLFQCSTVSGSVYTWVPFYNATQTLDNTTKAKYGLPNTATPNDAFGSLATNMVATRKTYPVKSGNNITAGDVVDVAGGEVKKAWTANTNEKVVFASAAVSNLSICTLTDKRSIVCRTHSNNTGVATRLNTENGKVTSISGDISFSTATVERSACVRVNDTSFIVQYIRDGVLYAITFSNLTDSSFSQGDEFLISAYATNYNALVPIGANKFFSVYNRGGLKGCAISTVAKYTESSLTGSTSVAYMSATRLPDDGTNLRVCVCYQDVGDSNKGKAVIATISASNVVTWGTPVEFETTAMSFNSCCTDGDDVVLAYSLGGTGRARVLGISGNSITVNSPVESPGGQHNSIKITKQENRFAICYGNGRGTSAVLTRAGSTLQKGETFEFNSSNANSVSASAINNTQLVVAYADVGNSNYGTATLLTVQNNQIAGSFTDTSSQAIALQSGTSPQSIEIIYDGVAPLNGITAGTQITSAGVQGYAPQDGWVWVKPYWNRLAERGTKIIFGTYTGDGGANRQINLGFKPTRVDLMGAASSSNGSIQYNILLQGGVSSLEITGSVIAVRNVGAAGALINSNGFITADNLAKMNVSGQTYYYYAYKDLEVAT